MAEQWHYTRFGKQAGPISASELRKLASTGELSPREYVWKEGMPKWVPAREIKGLFADESGSARPPVASTQNRHVAPGGPHRDEDPPANSAPRRKKKPIALIVSLCVGGGVLLLLAIVLIVFFATPSGGPSDEAIVKTLRNYCKGNCLFLAPLIKLPPNVGLSMGRSPDQVNLTEILVVKRRVDERRVGEYSDYGGALLVRVQIAGTCKARYGKEHGQFLSSIQDGVLPFEGQIDVRMLYSPPHKSGFDDVPGIWEVHNVVAVRPPS